MLVVTVAVACDRKPAPPAPTPPVTAAATEAKPPPSLAPPSGDPREEARRLLGAPPRPGREIGSVNAATNIDPQVNSAGVLVTTGSNNKIFTVYPSPEGPRVAGPIELGSVSLLATDGAHVCASDKRTLRCANIDGTGVGQRSTSVTETVGLWGGPGVFLRATAAGLESGLEASEDGFLSARRIGIPKRRAIVAACVQSRTHWTTVLIPTEGSIKPRYGLTVDGGQTAMGDFGALDRAGWSNGDRLWPDELVTGPFSTETVVAQRGEKQSTVTLPWSAAGGFAFAKHALLLFGRGASGSGGFLLVEFPARKVTTFVPPGSQPFIAGGVVGGSIVAITHEGKVLAWD